jgi:predicted component of type VI protein secretion system
MPNPGEHDADITAVESPNAILRRLVGHLRGVAISLGTAIPLLETLRGAELEYLAFALADEADELVDATKDLSPALRTIGRDVSPKGAP